LLAKSTQTMRVFRTNSVCEIHMPRIVAKNLQLFEGRRVLHIWGYLNLVSL
jgi:hypothetical protein